MKIYEEVFFTLLRAGLWKTPVEIPEGFDQWGRVARMAKEQSVLAMVGNVMLENPQIVEKLDMDFRARLKSFIMNSMLTHTMLNNTLLTVVSELRKHEVEGVLLKGQGIARNYPVPDLRQCGDIDFYVGVDNYIKTCEVLGNLASWKEDTAPMDTVKHYDIRIGKTTVEIHRYTDVNASSKYNAIYQKYSDDGMTRNLRVLNFAGTPVNTPSDDFNAFYVFNHMWHHFITSGVGLRQMCDWMLLLHNRRGTIDMDHLKAILTDMDLMKPWQAFGCVLVKDMGMPQEEFPFYDEKMACKRRRILAHVLSEGNFGQERAMAKNRRGEGYFYGKIKSMFLHIVRSSQLMLLFPSHSFRQMLSTLKAGFNAVWKDKICKNR